MTKKILIVDDLIEDLTQTQKILETEKYKVIAVTNGASALDAIQGNNFDLIIIDIQMPTLSGYDLMRLLRSQYDGKMSIIYLTIVPKKEVDLNNIDGFIQKPYTPKDLLKEVKRILLKRQKKSPSSKYTLHKSTTQKSTLKKSPPNKLPTKSIIKQKSHQIKPSKKKTR